MLLRSFSALRDAEIGSDGRTLVLACCPFDQPAIVDDGDGLGEYSEEFRRGAFANIVRAANRTELRYDHILDGPPYGFGIDLIEDPTHLIGRFRVAPSEQGDQILALVRDDQLGGVSIRFDPGTDSTSTRNGMRHVSRIRIKQMPEVSLTPSPSYEGTGVLAIRSRKPDVEPTPDLAVVERERLRWQRARITLL